MRLIVGSFYSRGLWIPRSDLHFALVRLHLAMGLIAMLLAGLALKKEPKPTFGSVAMLVAVLHSVGATV